ncbi:MAG TPA: T9SS type A sorting domain-containing protein [Cyclobacteriaceae bacterium]|jgi:hypothetical protein|nr:T9SS type A sorting domain-containing protein [Cyclobacteriaceae bacterium]
MKSNFALILLFFFEVQGFATHIRGGQITFARINGTTASYHIILTGYVHTSPVKPGGGTLSFGDGTPPITTPSQNLDPSQILTLSSAGPLYRYIFEVNHTFPGPGVYRISYYEQNFDSGIINFDNSVETPMFLESQLTIDPMFYIPSVAFASNPILIFALGKLFSFSTAPVDTTSAVYKYDLVAPNQAAGIPVSNYIFPENLQINSETGLLTWDTKFHNQYQAGEYLVAVRVDQFDKEGTHLNSAVTRVFSITLYQSTSKFSTTDPINDPLGKVLVLPGNRTKIKVMLSDSLTTDSISWEPYFDKALSNYISFTQYDSATITKKFKVGLLTLTSDNSISRGLPYEIILRGTSFFTDLFVAKDLSFLFFTKDVDLPVITGVTLLDKDIAPYPNPFTNELHFANDVQLEKIQIYNTLGQLVNQSVIYTKDYIDTSVLPAGIYILNVIGEDRKRFKVMKR